MRFDIYGRYQLEILRDGERWVLFRLDNGKRRPFTDFVVPGSLGPNDIATFLDDMLHEWAKPGESLGPNDIATFLDDMLHEWAKPGDTIRRTD